MAPILAEGAAPAEGSEEFPAPSLPEFSHKLIRELIRVPHDHLM